MTPEASDEVLASHHPPSSPAAMLKLLVYPALYIFRKGRGLDALTEANLKVLALDGRALRWASKGAKGSKGTIGSVAARAAKGRNRKPAKRK